MNRFLKASALLVVAGSIPALAAPPAHTPPQPPSTGGSRPGVPIDPTEIRAGGGIASAAIRLFTGPVPGADGYLDVAPDDYGAITQPFAGGAGPNDDRFNPLGAPLNLQVTFSSGFFLFVPGLLQRELLSDSADWQATYPADATLARTILTPNSSADTNADTLADMASSAFRVSGGTTDLRFNLTQRVYAGGAGVAVLQQSYVVTNDGAVPVSFNLVRSYDGDLLWNGDFSNDEVGTSMHGAGAGTYVYEQEDALPGTSAVTLSSKAASVYYGGKHGVTPPGGPPAYNFGTDLQLWNAYGVPASWQNNIAGVGNNVNGESGTAPPGSTAPRDGFTGLDVPLSLAPGDSTAVIIYHTYGRSSPLPQDPNCCRCPGDTNCDGIVNVTDLTNVILLWNTAGQAPGIDADLDNNGIVNVSDLTIVILGWGPCDDFGCDRIIQPGKDCWNTVCGGGSTYDFVDSPIPAGFFGPGSDPFTGSIELGGGKSPDTVVERLEAMGFNDDSLPDSDTIEIELVHLDLVSCAAITVTYSGGGAPETWDVLVGRLPASTPGSMTATKTNPNGGTFDSVLPIHPTFTFVRTSDSLTIGPVDFGVEFSIVGTGISWLQNIAVPGLQCDGSFAAGWHQGPDGKPRCEEICHPMIPPRGKEHCVQPCEIPRDCPPESNYGQRPHQPEEDWTFATSDKGPNFQRFDDFPHLGRPIEQLWFWGADLQFIPGIGFVECNLADPHFNIRFYPDLGGHPDKTVVVCEYLFLPAREKNRKADYNEPGPPIVKAWQYKVNLDPPCLLPPGKWWLSVQGSGGGPGDPSDCWFLWLSSPESNMPGSVFENASGVQVDEPFDLSFCINRTNPFGCPGEGPCCQPHTGQGCENIECCRRVCTIDPFCCDQAWDQICANEAGTFPQCGCGPIEPRIIPPGIDCWASTCGSQSILTLPAGFFGPGCQPFNGVVQLGGTGGGFGVDTQVQRLGPLIFDDSNLPSVATCPIEIVGLSLVSCQPITVVCGLQPQQWQVNVDIFGPGNPPQVQGLMTATKLTASGPGLPGTGTFDTFLPVNPLFSFIRLDGPGFIPPTPLGTFQLNSVGMPFLQGPGLPLFSCDPNFAPGYSLDPDGNPCCVEECHENPGGDHLHCTTPPKCQAPPCPTGLTCCGLPALLDEGEPCGADTNGGCNGTPVAFTPIHCGDTYCGTAWASGGMRDTDWYLLSVGSQTQITATLTSQFPGVVAVFNVNTCPAVFVGSFGHSTLCSANLQANACVPPGNYAIFVSTGNPNGTGIFDGIPCGGGNNDYHLEVQCAPCLPGAAPPTDGPVTAPDRLSAPPEYK